MVNMNLVIVHIWSFEFRFFQDISSMLGFSNESILLNKVLKTVHMTLPINSIESYCRITMKTFLSVQHIFQWYSRSQRLFCSSPFHSRTSSHVFHIHFVVFMLYCHLKMHKVLFLFYRDRKFRDEIRTKTITI